MFGFRKKAGVTMEKNKVFTEEELRVLTKPELARVEGGIEMDVDPDLKCTYCGQCFSTKLELKLHMKNCPKRRQ